MWVWSSQARWAEYSESGREGALWRNQGAIVCNFGKPYCKFQVTANSSTALCLNSVIIMHIGVLPLWLHVVSTSFLTDIVSLLAVQRERSRPHYLCWRGFVKKTLKSLLCPWSNYCNVMKTGYIICLWWGPQVLMKDIVTPVPPEEVKGVIRKCLEQAAQLNYQRIKEYAKIEGNQTHNSTQPNGCWSDCTGNIMWKMNPALVCGYPLWVAVGVCDETQMLLPPDFLFLTPVWDCICHYYLFPCSWWIHLVYFCPYPKQCRQFQIICDSLLVTFCLSVK